MDCLILIDLQEGFLHPRWGVRDNPRLEENVAALLAACRGAGKPVLHVRHDSREPESPLRAGTPGFAFLACAKPVAGESVITKREHAAFVGTRLEEELRARGLRAPLLAGLTTDHCVSTTARLAHDLGFEPAVAADATATFPRRKRDGTWLVAEETREAALASLSGEFARVLGMDQSLSEARSESVTAKRRS